ncbi:MAG: GAF domain-containing sensor histidine kinase, partial [Geminicoccaceae bacterium]|nr:GAF domain-containing sensor histidine kinase [Geminicoccaceae bacterium]
WVACAVRDELQFGLEPGGELKIDTTFCRQVRASGQPVVIDHVAEDQDFCGHPVPAMYGFQSYISMPIRRPGGEFFGTLCALDTRPAKLRTPETVGMFELFADLIGFHLDAQERLATSEAALIGERQAAELREQFIAVLGHDLRNPLASIRAGVRLLRGRALDEDAAKVVTLLENSVARMAGLIDNVLDFARGRLGGGLVLDRNAAEPLGAVLDQVIAELQSAWPDRRIKTEIVIPGPIPCDRMRIAQLLSNLLSNALSHGAADRPVTVKAFSKGGRFELSVANAGEPIPPAMLEHLFQPFFRAPDRTHHEGLGLGLYIAAEIARAHGGTLEVSSTARQTRFTFRMPLA